MMAQRGRRHYGEVFLGSPPAESRGSCVTFWQER
jgi:hypothetical protein